MTRNARDANAPDIIQALQAHGVHVQDMSNYGHGFPDIICFYQKKITLLEIKTEDGDLSEKQKAFFDIAMHHDVRCYVVRTVEQALKRVGIKWCKK